MMSRKQNGRIIWGEVCIKIMETSDKFILSDHCGQLREEGADIKVTNSNDKYNRYAYFRKEEYSIARF